MGLIRWSGRSPGEGNGNPLQCSCLENLMDRGAWWATVHEVARRCVGGSESITYIKRLVWCLASLVAQSVKNLPAKQETWIQFLG